MADKVTVKMTPDSRDLKSLYKAFREMDEGAKKALKDDVTSISAWSATELQSSYTFNPLPAQAQKVAATIRANKDRIPNVTIGGNKNRFSGGAVSGQVLFGSEFGGPAPFENGGRRFPECALRLGICHRRMLVQRHGTYQSNVKLFQQKNRCDDTSVL